MCRDGIALYTCECQPGIASFTRNVLTSTLALSRMESTATSSSVRTKCLHLCEIDRYVTCSWNADANANIRCEPTLKATRGSFTPGDSNGQRNVFSGLNRTFHFWVAAQKKYFLRNLDANFVQKWHKCQICVIYENLELRTYFWHDLMRFQDTQDGYVRRFPPRAPRRRVGTVRRVSSLVAPSNVCVSPDSQVKHSTEELEKHITTAASISSRTENRQSKNWKLSTKYISLPLQ